MSPRPSRIDRGNSGFTLVELSIVLAVIGLIIGGILVGQEMIGGAELQSAGRDIIQFKTATNNFKAKYRALPGDLPNATDFWPAVSAACTNQAGTNGQTCNGNGSGTVTYGTDDGGTSNYEMFRYWQHLALSGIFSGSYSGVAGSNNAAEHVGGVNAPVSRFRGGIYSVAYARNLGHFLALGAYNSAGSPWNVLATPTEALNFDSKIDDGLPDTGGVTASGTGCVTAVAGVNKFAIQTDPGSETPACTFFFNHVF